MVNNNGGVYSTDGLGRSRFVGKRFKAITQSWTDRHCVRGNSTKSIMNLFKVLGITRLLFKKDSVGFLMPINAPSRETQG